MRLKTIGENQLYRAFVLGGMAEAQSHLDGLVADFNRGKAEKAAPERRGLGGVIQKWRRSMAMSSSANASAEAEEAFEAFCGRPRAGGVALDGWAKSLEEQDLLASLPESATPGKARAARL